MSFCTNCGGEIPEGYGFCPYCGTQNEIKPEPVADNYVQPTESAAFEQPQYQQPVSPAYQPYSQPAEPAPQQPQYQQPAQPTYQPYSQQPSQPAPQQPDPFANAPYQPQQQQPGMPGMYAQPGEQQMYYQLADKAKSLGIVALIFSFIIPLVTWITGGKSLSKSGQAINYAQLTGDQQLADKAKSAKTLATIGLVISIINAIAGIVISVVNNM